MKEINVYNDIANKREQIFMSMWGMDDVIFSADTVKKILSENENETDLKFNIHCNGGSVSEGLAIYDLLRTSGKNLYTNIDGNCHSMAVVLLLAAPYENRTANLNSTALIHRVRAEVYGDMTADEAKNLGEIITKEEEKLLDIYEERTGKNRAALRALMNAEKERSAQELLEHGFISQINSYNTNKNFKKMEKTNQKNAKNLLEKANNLLVKMGNFFADIVNYDYMDADGNVLFSTEAEEDVLAVGDTVTIPDGSTEGVFTLPDGRVVTVVDNVVTAITTAEDSATVEELQAENAKLREMLKNAQQVITDLKNAIGSNYVPAGRTQNFGGKDGNGLTKEEIKNAANEKRKKMGGK